MLDTHVSTQPSREIFDQTRPLRRVRVHALPGVVILLLAGLVALQLWARSTDYGLRVTSDTPTFLALIPDMAERPFERQSPFLADDGVASPHAEPYMQALAFLWRAVGTDDTRDPIALVRLMSLVGIGVTFFVLFAVFAYARSIVGRYEAWIAVPALLALFGPANVIWASDLSLHGFLYASWFPQNVAIGFMLFALLALDWRRRASLPTTIALTALTMTIHPFTGVLLCLLFAVRGSQLAVKSDDRWRHASYALVAGFTLGSLWPAYSLSDAMSETGLRGGVFVALAAGAPLLAGSLAESRLMQRSVAAGEWFARRVSPRSWAHGLAVAGFLVVVTLGFWAAVLAHRPPSDPLVTTNRLSTYWVEDRWRWPLMLAAGAVGIYGLARLARKGRIVPAAWFVGCFALGTIGAFGSLAGIQIPIWYRFLLAAQIPLAVGMAAAIPGLAPRITRYVAAAAGFALAFKTLTLVGLPPTHTYFGTDIQEAYSLGKVIPPGPGLVATDPRTAYYIPGATGRRVLTVTKAHVGSPRELAAAEQGYVMLHDFWAGGPAWWQTAQEMWEQGVRWIVVEKSTLLSAPTLEEFSTGPSPLVHAGREREQLGNYYYENNRLGTLVSDGESYVVYRLDPRKLFEEGRRNGGTS
jgi:hypothetical protein